MPNSGQGQVLIIDRYEDDLLLIATFLEGLDYSVISASDWQTALSIARSNAGSFKFVIIDLMLPPVSAATAIQQLRQIIGSVPIIALTALAEPEHRQRALQAGCHEYLTKPCTLANLELVVTRYSQT